MKRYESYKDSGVKWLGEIPGHWEVYKLKYLFRLNKIKNVGNKCNTILSLSYGKIIIKKDLNEGLTPESYESYQLLNKGDIVIRSTDLQNDHTSLRTGLVKSDGAITSAYIGLKNLNVNLYDSRYYHYFLHDWDITKAIYNEGKGLRQSLNWDDIKNMLLPVLDINEQTAIANYLDSVTSKIDEAISQQKKLIDLLNERKQIIIQNAVTKGLDPNAKMKDSGVEWIGEIPEGWEKTYLKHIYVFEKGKNAQLYSSEYIGRNIGKYPVYSGQTENDGIMGYVNVCEYNIDECIFTTTVGAKVMTPRILRGKFTLSQNCLIMIPKNKPHHNLYIFYVLSIIFKYMKSEIPSYMQPSLRISDLNRISMYLPPYKTQIDIANFLKQNLYKIDSSINMSNKMISLLQERKQIIINDVVTGKVKVI